VLVDWSLRCEGLLAMAAVRQNVEAEAGSSEVESGHVAKATVT
jgi:hypothetical protein